MRKNVFLLMAVIATLSASAQGIDPRTMTAEYYQSLSFAPDTAWHFSPARYRDMAFYHPGRAHVEITIDNIPEDAREHFSSMSVSCEEQIMRREVTLSSSMDADNRFVFDIDLAGPMTVYFDPMGNYFIQPGDTLEIFTTMELNQFDEPRYTAFRSNSESAMINALLPKMYERLGVLQERGAYKALSKAVKEGKESSENLTEEWGAVVEKILTSEEARQVLVNSPLSTFGKDIMMTYAIAGMGENIEDVVQKYTYKQYIFEKQADGRTISRRDSTWVPLDYLRVYAPMLRHRDLFYDNPLVLSTGWPYVNRSIFGALFRNYEMIQVSENSYKQRKIDKYGMKGTFMFDLVQSQDFASDIKYLQQNVQLGKQQATQALDAYNPLFAENFAAISYPPVMKVVLDEYRAVVACLEGGKKESVEDKWTDEQRSLWQKIVAPYEGHLLYVDFWGMGCGPCRTGMIEMRDKVEALKDDAIRFLYVCDEKHSPRSEAEAWMKEMNIKGEHIYVTHDEWNQLQQMLNFNAIPHAVLANKQGRIIQNAFQIHQHNAEQLREMIKRF